MNNDYYRLFKDNLEMFKEVGGGEFTARCPYPNHEDKNPSFNGNYEKGLWICRGCGEDGNAPRFAEIIGHPNPKEFYDDKSYEYNSSYDVKYVTTPKKEKSTPKTKEFDPKLMDTYIDNLKNDLSCWDADIWDETLIESIGVGRDNKGLVFGFYDEDNVCDAIKYHKPCYWAKNSKSKTRWYPSNKTAEFTPKKTLYICEGMKDELTLLSARHQAITSSNGCQGIPKIHYDDGSWVYDLMWLKEYYDIVIVYDKDNGGKSGANKLAKAIVTMHPHLKVRIAQWDESYEEGFDVTDSFKLDGGVSFTRAVNNAIQIQNKERGLITMDGTDALKMVVPKQRMIIDNILPEHCQVILGGAEGSNKSFYSMQMGMAIANNDSEFLGFDINVKDLRVLFFDTECGINRLIRRYQILAEKMDFKGGNRFYFASKRGTIVDVYDMLEREVKRIKPHIVIVDCLYNTLGGADSSRNNQLQPILNRITDIRIKYNLTTWIIAHMNKGGHEQGLHIDRINGGGALKNWVEHCILLTYTNDETIRLMRFDKSRDEGTPKCYYELEWDYPMLKNLGVSTDWGSLLVTSEKKDKWDSVLRDLANEFTTNDFKNQLCVIRKMSEKTATNYLAEMTTSKAIKKIKHGYYKKGLKIRSKG